MNGKDSAPFDPKLDALQKAYNGLCTVEARLAEAGWQSSTLALDIADLRAQLGKAAYGSEEL